MSNAYVTIRMNDGEAPRITVAATRDYYHAQRRERVESTMTVDDAKLGRDHVADIRKAIQAILDANAEAIEHAVEYGAILSASAGTRAPNDESKAGATVPRRARES